MIKINLLHNEGAGTEDHPEEELVRLIVSEGFSCHYFSIKKGLWKKNLDKADAVVVAGGDGTVRKVLKEMLKVNGIEIIGPVAIMPMGIANNLSKTLGIFPEASRLEQIKGWKNPRFLNFDIGKMHLLSEKDVFLESVGLGVFPSLIHYMKHRREVSEEETVAEKLQTALRALVQIVRSYPAFSCSLKSETTSKNLNCLLVEVMNTRSIGPNLLLAPEAKTNDGKFDVVYIRENQRTAFADYLENIIAGKPGDFNFESFPCKSVALEAKTSQMHIDDELKELPESVSVRLEVMTKQIRFMI